MKKLLLILVAILAVSFSFGQESKKTVRKKSFNLMKSQIALKGYDPISYFDGTPQKGRKEINYNHKGILYRFINNENLRKFLKDKDKYEPAYGGWCAYFLSIEGLRKDIDPFTYKIINDKIHLFYKNFFDDNLVLWNRSEDTHLEQSLKNWNLIIDRLNLKFNAKY